jgi:hypothetical protein
MANENSGHMDNCKCDPCMGACSETNPYCGVCFACEEKEYNDQWWAANKADVLQI